MVIPETRCCKGFCESLIDISCSPRVLEGRFTREPLATTRYLQRVACNELPIFWVTRFYHVFSFMGWSSLR